MTSYKAKISYKGTGYFGWQIQPNYKTIQGELNKALKQISNSQNIYSIGSGRTDAGVHALGQIVRIDLPIDIEENGLLKGLNAYLPEEIRILELEKCLENFRPVFDAVEKEYQYLFMSKNPPPPQYKDLISFTPYQLNTKLIEQGCEVFLGEHDFKNFSTKGTPVPSTLRKIINCNLSFVQTDLFWGQSFEGYYCLNFVGNGFLKQMVRLMVGALWNLGRGKIALNDLKEGLNCSEYCHRLGPVAPAQGLYLKKVFYGL